MTANTGQSVGTFWPVLAVMAGWVVPLVHIGDGVKRIQMRGYNEMELSDGVFTIWNTFDAARWVHVALGQVPCVHT